MNITIPNVVIFKQIDHCIQSDTQDTQYLHSG